MAYLHENREKVTNEVNSAIKEIYKDDYEHVMSRTLEGKVSYEVAIEAVRKIAVSGMFEQPASKEENNIRYLEKKMADYKAGKLKVEEHELIEE